MPYAIKNEPIIVVVCHGMSEVRIAQSLKKYLKINIKIIANDNGRNHICLETLRDELEKNDFHKSKFLGKFKPGTDKPDFQNIKIFVLMDEDSASKDLVNQFRSKEIFKFLDLPLDIIYPILSVRSLDDLFKKMGYQIPSKQKPVAYEEIFKFKKEDSCYHDKLIKIIELSKKYKTHSNFHEFLEFIYTL